MTQAAREVLIVRLGVWAEISALAEEFDTEFAVTLDVFELQTRTLGGETVGPAEDRELLAEGPYSPGEPLGRIVGPGVAHEAYLEVQRREGDREICEAGGKPKTPADAMGQARPQSVVGNEKHVSLDLPASNGLGDIVQQADQSEPPVPLLVYPGTGPALHKLPLYAPDGFEDVLESIEVVERTLLLAPSEPELRHLAEQRSRIERGRECLMDGRVYQPKLWPQRRRRRAAFLRLVLGL